jgi:hypothetical protein
MTEALTPKERLALSRASLLAAMGYRNVVTDTGEQIVRVVKEPAAAADTWTRRVEDKIERSVVGSWWRRSHLSTVTELGRPFLQDYAAKHPGKLVAYAAGTGSLIVLVRPWRLLSLGMIVGLVVRSTDIAGMVSDYLVPQLGDTDAPRDDFLDQAPGRSA